MKISMRLNPDRSAEQLKIIAPAVMAVILFVVAVFGVFLPAHRQSLLNGKKEMILELTRTAWNIMAGFEARERSGAMTRSEAQQAAADQIRLLRYGPENKDYFWINDLRPSMIMHPYRPDLEGRELSDFRDLRGDRPFMRFVETVKKNNEGFVDYSWQRKDDPSHIVPKLSFVKVFAPWGWIIGTGIYLDDVKQEATRLTRELIWASLGIFALVFLLSLLLAIQAIKASGLRRQAERQLRDHQAQLEQLVAQRTADLQQTNDTLRCAMADIKNLRGILPICSFCKQIRDDQGYWNQLEKYVSEHSDAEFSHGICPKCMAKYYPDA